MYSKHPLQRFLDRHDLSQSDLARAMHISRETVNRWIRRHNIPVGENLIRAVDFAKRFEPHLEAHELFPTSARYREPRTGFSEITSSWGEGCAICEVPWNEATEHLPLALLHPEIGTHPAGDLCQACARRTGTDPTDEQAEPGSEPDSGPGSGPQSEPASGKARR